jgi:hypothetical protein
MGRLWEAHYTDMAKMAWRWGREAAVLDKFKNRNDALDVYVLEDSLSEAGQWCGFDDGSASASASRQMSSASFHLTLVWQNRVYFAVS